ncbi:LOW QUALITY PROTEIN: hypothetical protein V2J09_016041 [Rumex salicifolius]
MANVHKGKRVHCHTPCLPKMPRGLDTTEQQPGSGFPTNRGTGDDHLMAHHNLQARPIVHNAHSMRLEKQSQLMFPLHFHYEDVSGQEPLLKPNHANVMEVPGSCEIRVVSKAAPSYFQKNGKFAMEIPCD